MTFAELKTRVYAILGEDSSSPEHFSDAELGRLINDTHRRMARESGALEVEHLVDIVAGTATYDLPRNVDRVFRVAYDGEKIFPTSVHELDRYDKGWETRQGAVQFYHLDRLNHHKINIWRVPETEQRAVFDAELGTIIDGTFAANTTQFRFESDEVSLGTVVDYTQDSDTVTFEAAADGGGSDAGYGIVVDIASTETGAEYALDTELGTIVDFDETTKAAYDTEVFVETEPGGAADQDTGSTELGVVTDFDTDDTSDIYIFKDESGDEYDVYAFGAEVGITTDMTLAALSAETGMAVRLADSDGTDSYVFSSEFGIAVRADEQELGIVIDYDSPTLNLEIWAKEDPEDMVDGSDEPRLPHHSHQGIVYGAAAMALGKNSEIGNASLARVLSALEMEYIDFLKKLIVRRTPERLTRMESVERDSRVAVRHPRLPSAYPRVHF